MDSSTFPVTRRRVVHVRPRVHAIFTAPYVVLPFINEDPTMIKTSSSRNSDIEGPRTRLCTSIPNHYYWYKRHDCVFHGHLSQGADTHDPYTIGALDLWPEMSWSYPKKAALDAPGFKEVLDAEWDKTDLQCHNCHHRKTNYYPMRK